MDLFPAPSLSPAKLSPNPWPGVTPESTNALRELLKDNHEKWHVFFDPRGFHNHTAHYLSALWALGADAEVLKVAYTLDTPHQVPIKEYPEPVTEKNFKEHLGNEKYFGGYLKYYEEYIKDKDLSDILEKQIFSLEANFDPSRPADKQPAMLDRFLDAIIHPMIHVGYGLELGIPGLLVEGLASTATHQASGSKLLPRSLWKAETSTTVDSLTRILPSILRFSSSAPPSLNKNVHAFDIVSRMLKDPAFDNVEEPYYLDVWIIAMQKYGDLIEKHVQAWTYDNTDPNEFNKKLEELVYTNTLIYGVAGWTKGEEFNADFLYMHLVTTSIFLPTIAAYLKPQSQELLLRSYLVISLAWWVAHGRQNFDIEGFFTETNAYPVPSGPKAPVHGHALPNASSFKAATPNPWLHIIQGSIAHPDDHLPKLQRALAHWGSIFGSRPAGQADFASTELKSADKIDGTIFIRTAGLTHERATAFKEGYTNTGFGTWDRKGFKEKRDGGVQEH